MKRKGLTLIELLLSLGILSILIVVISSSISGNFLLLNRTLLLSKENLVYQGKMEEKINLNREMGGKTNSISIRLFSDEGPIVVPYELVEETLANREKIIGWIPENKSLDLKKLNLFSLKIGSNCQDNYSEEAIWAYNTCRIEGVYRDDPLGERDLLLTQVEWYVSNGKSSIASPKSFMDKDEYLKTKFFPVFPDDYTIVKNQTIYNYSPIDKRVSFNLEEKYLGKHVVLGLTPGSKSGKIGNLSHTSPIFISHIPKSIEDKLIDHIDINLEDYYKLDNKMFLEFENGFKGLGKKIKPSDLNHIYEEEKNIAFIMVYGKVEDGESDGIDLFKSGKPILTSSIPLDEEEVYLLEIIKYDTKHLGDEEENLLNILNEKYRLKGGK